MHYECSDSVLVLVRTVYENMHMETESMHTCARMQGREDAAMV